jgi:hypothetical protein
MNLKQIGPFAGMNNRRPDTRLANADGSTFLRNAVNVDLTASGTLKRRPGVELAIAGADAHSLWGSDQAAYYIDGTDLCEVAQGIKKNVIRSGLIPGRRASFARVGEDVYWSNGIVIERITAGISGAAGAPTPNPVPVVTYGSGGSLPAGIYQVAFTQVIDGEESGSTWPQMIEIPANGRIDVSGIDAGTAVNVYMTPANGDVLFLVAELDGASSTTFTVMPALRRQIPTLGLCPMPAGHIVRYYNGRLLVARDNILYYSEPYAPALHNPMRGYIPFPERITVMEPCDNGVYVASDTTRWLDGPDIDKAEAVEVLPYGAVEGTGSCPENDKAVYWFSTRGMVIGDASGSVKNIQEDTVAVDPAAVGAALYREQDGLRQAITSLFGTEASVAAATSFMDAEIVRKESML